MAKKLYLAFLVLAGIASVFSAFYANKWLSSIGNPATASAGFEYHTAFGWNLMWFSFLVMVCASALILWQSKSKWPLWTTLGYFVLSLAMFLNNASSYRAFLESNAITGTALTPFTAAVLIVMFVITLAVIQVLVLNLRIKIKKEPIKEKADEEKTEK